MSAANQWGNGRDVRLADLLDMEVPEAVLAEVHHILRLIYPDYHSGRLDAVFADVVALFEGRYPGYRASNALYHSLSHTTDTFLALARLIHGATLEGMAFGEHEVLLGLVAALLHDTGYIQTLDDTTGTGAKYTQIHIRRSSEFMRGYFASHGFSQGDFALSNSILHCTGLDVHINTIRFPARSAELLGKMLGVADLLGQMADRHYLEKLSLLYREFVEGGVTFFKSELDLMRKTPAFREMNKKRFAEELESMDRLMKPHFVARWGLDCDLYVKSIDSQMAHLGTLLAERPHDYRGALRRKERLRGKPLNGA